MVNSLGSVQPVVLVVGGSVCASTIGGTLPAELSSRIEGGVA